MAKAWIRNAYKQIALSGCVIHGGLSATLDSDIQLYYRRAQMATLTFGDPGFHQIVIARELIGSGQKRTGFVSTYNDQPSALASSP